MAIGLLLGSVGSTSAATVTVPLTAPTLSTDGLCVAGNATSFQTTYTVSLTTPDDGVDQDYYWVYLVDGSGLVLSVAGHGSTVGFTFPGSDTLPTAVTPVSGPFRIVFYDQTGPVFAPDFPTGTIAAFVPALISDEISFDPTALDPDCLAGTPAPAPAGPTPQDKSNITNHLLSAFNQIGGSIFEPEGVPTQIVNGSGGADESGFTLAPNTPALAARINNADPFDRLYGFGNNRQGNDALAGHDAGKGFNFSIDMNSLIANARREEAIRLGRADYKGEDYVPPSPWNFWTSGRYVDFDDGTTGADRDGHLWWLTSGVSYQLSQTTTIGAFSRVRQGEVDSVSLNANLDSDFYGGGAFIAATSGSGMRLLAGALYEMGDNDINITGAAGSFDTDQVTLEARLDQRFAVGDHWIEPAVKVLYAHMSRDSYTDSTGTVVPGSDLDLGRVTFGPTIGTTWQSGSTLIKPFARINGVWDFENEGDFTLSTGTVVSSADTAINLGGGVEVALTNGVAIKLAGDWYNFDSDFDAWSVTGGVGMPASVLGLDGFAGAGLVSLDFASSEESSSAAARLRIPLDGLN